MSDLIRCFTNSIPASRTIQSSASNVLEIRKITRLARQAVGSALSAPRIFMMAKPTCNAIKANALVCQPHGIQSALLSRKSQNPQVRLVGFVDATSHDANNVTAIAGHWSWLSKSIETPPQDCSKKLRGLDTHHSVPVNSGLMASMIFSKLTLE